MGDRTTLAAYEAAAAAYATEWEDDQDVPADLYELLGEFFRPGSVIEIGCGSGRDAAWLAGLTEVGPQRAANVLCETVLMHLPVAEIAAAAGRLYELVEPGGTLYVSWRVTDGADRRDPAGRLYSAFEPGLILGSFGRAVILHDEERRSASSGRTVHRVIARRPR
jgi:protein-L-isoaspartate O-methyltransferase